MSGVVEFRAKTPRPDDPKNLNLVIHNMYCDKLSHKKYIKNMSSNAMIKTATKKLIAEEKVTYDRLRIHLDEKLKEQSRIDAEVQELIYLLTLADDRLDKLEKMIDP